MTLTSDDGEEGTELTSQQVERATGLPLLLLLVSGVAALIMTASALLGSPRDPGFFVTYALIQGVIFLGLIYLADLYEREPVTVVALMVMWGLTFACVLALSGHAIVSTLLPPHVNAVFGSAISEPIVEEASKGLALLIAFWVSMVAARRLGTQPFEGLTDGLVYGAAVGLGFAFTEDVFNLFNYSQLEDFQQGYEVFQTRVDLFGFNMLGHALYTGLLGAGVGAASVMVRPWKKAVVAGAGFAAAVVAHAVHNGLGATMLTLRYGLDTAAGVLGDPPEGLRPDISTTMESAAALTRNVDKGFLVAFVAAVALWVRHQQHVIIKELEGEAPEVAPPLHADLVVHYARRLRNYGRLILDGKLEEWRLARMLTAEMVTLAFLKHRVRTGRADVVELDNQRYLTAWAAAALKAHRDQPGKGSTELLALSDEALRSSRYDLASSLLTVRAELVVPDDVMRGQMAVLAGRHLAEGGFRPEDALQEFDKAVACFDRGLARDPGNSAAHCHRAGALFRRGEAQAAIARIDEAKSSFEAGVNSADAALVLEPDLAEAHRNRAAASMRLGEVELRRGRASDAVVPLQQAVKSATATLELTPDDSRAHNIAGLALRGLGEALIATGAGDQAERSLERAVAAGAEAVRLIPDFAYAHVNRGLAWARLAELKLEKGSPRDSEFGYVQAIADFDRALAGNPDYVKGLAERGGVRVGLARLQLSEHRLEAAEEQVALALEDCERACVLAPAHAPAQIHRVRTLLLRADLEAHQNRPGSAAEAAEAALHACEGAIGMAPDTALLRSQAQALLTLVQTGE